LISKSYIFHQNTIFFIDDEFWSKICILILNLENYFSIEIIYKFLFISCDIIKNVLSSLVFKIKEAEILHIVDFERKFKLECLKFSGLLQVLIEKNNDNKEIERLCYSLHGNLVKIKLAIYIES
jgi:hypothetical protein